MSYRSQDSNKYCFSDWTLPIHCEKCELLFPPRNYSQPGDALWPNKTDLDNFSATISGSNISCLGLKRFVRYDEMTAHKQVCLPYTGLVPDSSTVLSEHGTCSIPYLASTYGQPDQSCDPNPFVTSAYYNDTTNQYACMTPYQFLNNRNYKKEWMASFIVTAGSPSDIQKAIGFARKHHLGLSILSTGHDMQDRNAGPGPNTLMIRTTCLSNWKVHNNDISLGNVTWSEGYAEVGAGLTFGRNFWWAIKNGKGTYELAAQANKEMVGGTCHSVGVVGWTIGGGRGWTSPKYGLGVDQLIHVNLVNAKGDLVSANHTHNRDLFYAIRGGGGGFGIIYSMKIKLHNSSCQQMTDCFTKFDYTWSGVFNGSSDKNGTIDYVKKILFSYANWSIKYRGTWSSLLQLQYDQPQKGHFRLYIGATSLGGDKTTFNKTFSTFKQDRKESFVNTTSKYWCEIFPDFKNGNNCTDIKWWVSRWKQSIRFLIDGKTMKNESSAGFVETMLRYWQPLCDLNPFSACASQWQIEGDHPHINKLTGKGIHDSGGPIPSGFRKENNKKVIGGR